MADSLGHTDKENIIDQLDSFMGYKMSEDLVKGMEKLTIPHLRELLKVIQETC